MKIYISALPLTFVVILHIHVSSSTSLPPGGEISLHTIRTEVPPHQGASSSHAGGTSEFPGVLELPNKNSNNLVPTYVGKILNSVYYAGRIYKIAEIKTYAARKEFIREGVDLYRCNKDGDKGRVIAVFNGHDFITTNVFYKQFGTTHEPQPNDFLGLDKKPYGWFSHHGLRLFAYEEQSPKVSLVEPH